MKGLFRWLVVLMVLIALVMVPVASAQTPTPAAFSGACFRTDGGDLTVAASGCTYAFLSGSTFEVATDITQSDGDLTVADDLTIAKQTAIAVTDNSTITPTGTFQLLSAAAATATSSITAGTAGQVVIFTNTSTNTIVLTDTGTLMLTGNITLGQYDTLTLISDGTNWLQLSTANN